MKRVLATALLLAASATVLAQTITTIAGTGAPGAPGDNVPATVSPLNGPRHAVSDAAGNFYVSDTANHVVRKITPAGAISRYAGTGVAGSGAGSPGGAPALTSALNGPTALALAADGTLYIADTQNSRIMRVLTNGTMESMTEGLGLNKPEGVALSFNGRLVISDTGNNRVMHDDISGPVDKLGPGDVCAPKGIAYVSQHVYLIADSCNNRVIQATMGNGVTTASTPVAGNGSAGTSGDGGSALAAAILAPRDVAWDSTAQTFYVATADRVRAVRSGTIRTLAGGAVAGYNGDGLPTLSARLNAPSGLHVRSNGSVYIADTQNHRVRRVAFMLPGAPTITSAIAGVTQVVVTIAPPASDGGMPLTLYTATCNGVSASGGTPLVVSGLAYNTSYSCTVTASNSVGQGPASAAVVAATPPVATIATIAQRNNEVWTSCFTGTAGGNTGNGASALNATVRPTLTTVDAAGNIYFVEGQNRVRRIDTFGVITAIAGNGTDPYVADGGAATATGIGPVTGLAVDVAGNVYIATSTHNRVRKVTPGGVISTFAGNGVAGSTGNGTPASSAQIDSPRGLAIDSAGNLYIATLGYIRSVTPGGTIGSAAGNGTTVVAEGPAGSVGMNPGALAIDAADALYFLDITNNVLRRLKTGQVITYAGNGALGHGGDGGFAKNAPLVTTGQITVDTRGNLYVAYDYSPGVNRFYGIREIDTRGVIRHVSGPVNDPGGTAGTSYGAGVALPGSVAGSARGVAAEPSGGLVTAEGCRLARISFPTPAAPRLLSARAGSRLVSLAFAPADGWGPVPASYTASCNGGAVTGTGTFSPIAIAGLIPGSSYTCSVKAHSAQGTSPDSSSSAALTPFDAFIHTIAGTGANTSNGNGGPATAAAAKPAGVALAPDGTVYFSEYDGHRIRKISPDGTVSLVAGTGVAGYSNGTAATSQLNLPHALALDAAGNLYFSEWGNFVIRRISPAGVLSDFIGTGASGCCGNAIADVSSMFFAPDGGLIFTDRSNHRIRRADVNGNTTTLVGTGAPGFSGDGGAATQAQLNFPLYVRMDGQGNLIIGDGGNARVRRVLYANASIETIAGSGSTTFSGDGGPATAAGMALPYELEIPGDGTLYVGDFSDRRIRVVAGGAIRTIAGNGIDDYAGNGVSAVTSGIRPNGAFATDASGNLYVGNYEASRLRKITLGRTAAPVIGVATGNSGQTVTVAFTPPPSEGGFAPTQYTATCGAQSASGPASPITVSNLIAGVPVTCTVTASHPFGPSSPSQPSNVAIPSAAPLITSGAPPNATLGVAYTHVVTTSGYPAPTFSISAGSLPPGLTLYADSGAIAGVPTVAGNYGGTIAADNGVGPAQQQAFSFFVDPLPTTTMVAGPATTNVLTGVTFTATVTGQSALFPPTGTVNFRRSDTTSLPGCLSPVPVVFNAGSYTATCNAVSLPAGSNDILAFYSGDSANAASVSGAHTIVVNKLASTTVVNGPSTSIQGTNVLFIATVTGTAPTGSVEFRDGGVTIPGCASIPMGSGDAYCNTSTLPLGAHSITAFYLGDTVHLTSTSSALPHTVNAVTFTVTPSVVGGGTILPNTAVTVVQGATTPFVVTPNAGFKTYMSGTCGGTLVGTSYTTALIVADCSVIATFRAQQAITWGALANVASTSPPIVISPAPTGGTSGNPVVLASITTAICGVSGITITLTGALGACTITADQAGSATHDPAPLVARTFQVTRVFDIVIEGGQVVPVNAATATGTGQVIVNVGAKTLTYSTTVTGLTGAATVVAFHGPAARGATAAMKIDITASPASGSVPYLPADEAAILAGLWYVEFQTAAFPNGEVRGQLDDDDEVDRHLLTVATAGTGIGTVTSDVGGISCGVACTYNAPEDLVITLTPAPDVSSAFSGWSGACTGMGACVVTMDAAKSVTATFTLGSYNLTVSKSGSAAAAGSVTSAPAGINCDPTCTAVYSHGTVVTLTPTPGPNSAFAGWTGACTGIGSCVVTMDAAKSVEAVFSLVGRTLTVVVTSELFIGNKVQSAPPAIDCGFDCDAGFVHGTVVTLVATPAAHMEFAGWGGACTGTGNCVVTMDADRNVTAHFIPTLFAVTIVKSGSGSGTVQSSDLAIDCGATCSVGYPFGSVVLLNASAAPGSAFAGFSGACGPGPCTLTVDGAKIVTATFSLIPRTLNVTLIGAGTGTVTSSPAGINCGATCSAPFGNGTLVTLTATPSSGAVFAGWSGAGCSGTGTCVVTMDAQKTVIAEFTQTFLLTVTKAGTGAGTVTSSPAGVNCGSTCAAAFVPVAVTLTAAPAVGSTFAGWSGACTGTGSCVVVTSSAKNVTATFTLAQVTFTVTPSAGANGSISPSTAQTVNQGATTSFTVTPSAGFAIDTVAGCGGALIGSTYTTAAVTANCTVTATFAIVNPPRLGNISTRMQVLTGNDVMIGGFVIGGSTTKRVAIVATGPSLVPFGITNALANPTLSLVRSSDQTVLATSDDWQTAANAAQLTAAGFAPTNTLEAAILADLAPGAYTAIVQGAGGLTGVAVVGVYEVNHPETPLINISTRGRVLTGNDVMIGGFVINGTGPQTLAIVATGPSLAAFGITSPLANPTITLVRSSDQAVIATNDDWQTDASASLLQSAGFAPTNPLESGLYRTLPPGAYTVIVQGVNNGTGVAVIGVYKVN